MPGPLAIGWVGVGAMGAPMARRVAAAGFDVAIYDKDPLRLSSLSGSSALRVSMTVQEALSEADVAVLMVATPAQAEDVLFSSPGAMTSMRPGTVVLVMATVGPDAISSWASRLAGSGVTIVDAPVSGGTARAESGELLAMVGGEADAVARVSPVLSAMANNIVVVGPAPGDGQRMKLVNQLLCGVHVAVAGEALAFAEALGLEARQCWEVLRQGAAVSFMFEDRGARMLDEKFEPPRSALDIFVKDLSLVQRAARNAGFSAPLAGTAEQIFLSGHRAGLGRLDDSVVIEIMRGRT